MSVLNIYCDGSCYNQDGRMGMGVAFYEDDTYNTIWSLSLSSGNQRGTNNEAEYIAIIHALKQLSRRPSIYGRYQHIIIHSDSQIVINQINKTYQINSEKLESMSGLVRSLLQTLICIWGNIITFEWVPREDRRQQVADTLSKRGNLYYKEKGEMVK